MPEIQPVAPAFPLTKLNKVKKDDNFPEKEQPKNQPLEKSEEPDAETLPHIDEIV
ncbi:conserved hypothetical protein [Candidatus Methylobacter favarea]|uniref:Uncharacterized protein n=1 Tax=Candidatus Methylobacter favarea TaxID=2707345 RepID=A0A8S0X123_9GAMM|nr:hypothetical protein [Candidatus Methylobacter favarea]CAA9890978.1 conserved hypothetical protein [Candidatus Methylobacter favarea]